jgi:hypothetical protein
MRPITRQLSCDLSPERFRLFGIPKFLPYVVPKNAAPSFEMEKIAHHGAQPSAGVTLT